MKKHYNKIGWIMFPWAILVSYSRIYMGVHFPGDIICGAAVGMMLGFGIGWLLNHTVISSGTQRSEV